MPQPHPRFYRALLAALLAAGVSGAIAAPVATPLSIACGAESAPLASLDGVQVRKMAAGAGDLAYYEAHSTTTGNSVRIYYEPDLEQAAASKAACLMGTLDLLAAQLPHLRGPLRWWPLVLTHQANYIPLKRDGETRWSTVFDGTEWDATNLRFLLVVMPHEETHLSQDAGGASMPRWFVEGHAEWAALHVTEQISPPLAASERAGRTEAAAKLGAPKLGGWGGLRVTPEAIER